MARTIRYLDRSDLSFWERTYKHIVLERDNNIIKNIIRGQCFINEDIYKNFERWVKE